MAGYPEKQIDFLTEFPTDKNREAIIPVILAYLRELYPAYKEYREKIGNMPPDLQGIMAEIIGEYENAIAVYKKYKML